MIQTEMPKKIAKSSPLKSRKGSPRKTSPRKTSRKQMPEEAEVAVPNTAAAPAGA